MVIREYLCVVSPANQLSQRNETIFYVPIYIEKRRGKKKELNIPVVVLETTTLTAGRNPPINDDKPATTLKSKHTKKKKRKRGETIYAASKTKPKRRLFEEKKKKTQQIQTKTFSNERKQSSGNTNLPPGLSLGVAILGQRHTEPEDQVTTPQVFASNPPSPVEPATS